MYRSPLSSVVDFIDNLEDILQCINLNFIENTVVLAGDVNINLLLANSRNVELYLNTVFSYDLVPQVYWPTRVTSHSATLIDHIIVIILLL